MQLSEQMEPAHKTVTMKCCPIESVTSLLGQVFIRLQKKMCPMAYKPHPPVGLHRGAGAAEKPLVWAVCVCGVVPVRLFESTYWPVMNHALRRKAPS